MYALWFQLFTKKARGQAIQDALGMVVPAVLFDRNRTGKRSQFGTSLGRLCELGKCARQSLTVSRPRQNGRFAILQDRSDLLQIGRHNGPAHRHVFEQLGR